MDETQVQNMLYNVIGHDVEIIFMINHVDGDTFDLIFDGNETFHPDMIFDSLEEYGWNPSKSEWRSPAESGVEIVTEADYMDDWYLEVEVPL